MSQGVLKIRVLYNRAWSVVSGVPSTLFIIIMTLMFVDYFPNGTTKQVHNSSHSKANLLVCIPVFSQAGEDLEIKAITVYYHAAYIPMRQPTISNSSWIIFLCRVLIFYEYHKNKKLMALFALLPPHTYPHKAFKSNLPLSLWYMRILIFICIALKKSWESLA